MQRLERSDLGTRYRRCRAPRRSEASALGIALPDGSRLTDPDRAEHYGQSDDPSVRIKLFA
jgi:hypothetical protein